MPPPEDDVAATLLARAEDDIALVRMSIGAAEIADAVVGFHAQQAAEKLLKAALARRRVTCGAHAVGSGVPLRGGPRGRS